MSYRFRLYAPTDGVLFIDVYYDNEYRVSCIPKGTSTPCWDEEINATTVAVEAVLEDGYRVTTWKVNLDGVTYDTGQDTEYYSLQPGAVSSLIYKIEVEEIPKYYATLKFDANGGDGAPDAIEDNWTTNVNQLVHFDIPEDELTRGGYVFGGWSEFEDGGEPIWQAGDAYANYGSEDGEEYTLYAVWIKTGGGINIETGSGAESGTVYVWDSGEWVQGTVYVWDNGTWTKGV